MTKRFILNQLINNEISTEIALKKLLLLAIDLDNVFLKTWAKKELEGYDKNDEVPAYRKIQSLNFIYSGFNGIYQITNNPLPLSFFNLSTSEEIKEIEIKDSIKIIQEKSQIFDKQLYIDRTYLAGEVYKNTSREFLGIRCFKISQIFQSSQYTEIINKINLKMLEFFLELEKKFGNLDNLNIISKKSNEIQKFENQTQIMIKKITMVNIGDYNKFDKPILCNERQDVIKLNNNKIKNLVFKNQIKIKEIKSKYNFWTLIFFPLIVIIIGELIIRLI